MGKQQASLSGSVAELRKKKDHLEAAKQGQASHLNYLERQLADNQQKLEKARTDEKNFTWWMFGSRTYLFENDVKLAKEKVAKYTEQQAMLENRIESLKNGNDQAIRQLHNDAEQTAGLSAEHEKLVELKNEELAENIKAINDKDRQIAEVTSAIEEKLGAEGKVSFKHLMHAQLTLNQFAECADWAAGVGQAEQAEWVSELENVKDLTEYVVEAPTRKKQLQALSAFRNIVTAPNLPIMNFIKEAKVHTLKPTPGTVKWIDELSDEGVGNGSPSSRGSGPSRPAMICD